MAGEEIGYIILSEDSQGDVRIEGGVAGEAVFGCGDDAVSVVVWGESIYDGGFSW